MRLVALALALALLGACAGLQGTRISSEQREAYEGALESLDRDPDLAQQRLEQFLRRWPEGPLADDARMRLGEIALARGDDDTALRHFYYVVRNFSNGDQIDLARLRAAQIRIDQGDAPAAEQLLKRVRLSRLSREEQRAGYRALADAAPDDVTRLLRLATLRAFEGDDDAVALTDVEIDRILLELERADLERAADQLGDGIPAARVRLRAAELALEGGDVSQAREQLERASQLPLAPAYAARLQSAAERLEMREAGLAPEGEALPTFSEAAVVGRPRTAGATGTLGVVLPLSGDFADFGEESLRGILLAAGVFDPPPGSATNVRVLIRDTRGRPERAAEAVRDLAKHDEVSAILGPLLAGECEAAAEAAQRAGVPLLALTSREEIAATRSQVLRVRTRPKEEVATLVDHAVRELGARTFAILYPNDAYGLGLRDLFWDAVEEQGGAVVGVARYDPQATDFAEPIRRLVGYVLLSPEEQQALQKREQMLRRARRLPPEKALELREQARALTGPEGEPLPPIVDFDALFIPESHEKVVLIAPQLAFHEALGTRLLGPSGWYHPDLVPIGRDHVEGALFTAQFFPESELPMVREFTDRYLETFAATPEAFAAQGYDAANLVLMQLANGRHSRDDVRRGVLATRAFPGVTGVLSMRADGNARKRPFLLGIERGQIVQLE
jgi:ABC-type branched-subunit amino acid transport system substrate-binding protein